MNGKRRFIVAAAIIMGGAVFCSSHQSAWGADKAKPPGKAETPDKAKVPGKAEAPAKAMTPAELYAKASPAVVRIIAYGKDRKPLGLGSGFFINATGRLVTNYHVIKGATSISIVMANNTKLSARRIAGMNVAGDLAMLDTDAKKVPFLEIGKKIPAVGANVYAIGSPLGLKNTITNGIVSQVRLDGDTLLLQTTAPISQGSSGGPLLTLDGQVVGVNTFTLVEGQALNFAVSSGDVLRLLAAVWSRGGTGRTVVMGGTGRAVRPTAAGRIPPAPAPIETKPRKRYDHLSKVLREIPVKFFPAQNVRFNEMQKDLVNKWISENLIGSEVLVKGRLARSPEGGQDDGVLLTFPQDRILLNRNTLRLNLFAVFKGQHAVELAKHNRGDVVTLHGKVAVLGLSRKYSSAYGWVIVLDNCAPGPFPKTVPPKPKDGAATKPATSPEKKAAGQLGMARAYLGFGKKGQARDMLEAIIENYPKTRAAADARKELDKLK